MNGNYAVEIERNNVTARGFFNYVKRQLAKKGIQIFVEDFDTFSNPPQYSIHSYSSYVKNGVLFVSNNCGKYFEVGGGEYLFKSENCICKPFEHQYCVKNQDDSLFNEIIEWNDNGDGNGHGYYWTESRLAEQGE